MNKYNDREELVPIRLFQETVTCRSCFHTWFGYIHGFCRGHGVLSRDGIIAFVPDDLLYAFADQISSDPSRPPGDPADLLRAHGWRDIEQCPSCGARDFVGKFDQSLMIDIECLEFNSEDFSLNNNVWKFTPLGEKKCQFIK